MLLSRYRIILLQALFCLSFTMTRAQTFTISGKITAAADTVSAATVSLLKAADSSWVVSVLSNDTGRFSMKEVKPGLYLLHIRALGYIAWQQPLQVSADINNLDIRLIPSGNTLEEVRIKDKAPFIEMAPGKLVVNVDQAISSSGTTVLDLLIKTPGIRVSGNGDISMEGKQGVTVMVNNRPLYLAGEELAAYLRTMSSDQVAQLELITQPSARYDAEGNAGIINIITKKSRKAGFNGSFSSSYTWGRYPILAQVLTFNYRGTRFSYWFQGEYHIGKYYLDNDLQRTFRSNQDYAVTGNMSQQMYLWERPTGVNLNQGFDYSLTAKTSIGALLWLNYNPVPYGSSTDAVFYDNATQAYTYNHADFYADQLRRRATASFYVQHRFSKDRELNLGLDYMKYWMRSYPELNNTNTDGSGNILEGLVLKGRLPTDIDVYSFRADHRTKYKKLSVESGFKISLVRTENAAYYDLLQNNQWNYDSSRSNHFLYLENINSTYVNTARDFGKKWALQLGLRLESTLARGEQSVNDQEFLRNYLSLFPSAFLTYKANDKHRWEFNFGRRIQRPEYRSLNPFIKFISQYVYEVGNPALQPQFSNNFTLRHSYKNMLFSSLGYSHITSIRQNIVTVDEISRISYNRPENAGTNDLLNLSFNCNKQFKPWLQLSLSANGYYSWYQGIVNGRKVKVSGPGYSFGFNSQLQLGKGWTATVNMHYTGISQDALISRSGNWLYTEAGISKRFWKDQVRARLNVQDPFYLSANTITSRLNELDSHTTMRFYTRQVRLTLTWYFGKETEQKQQRKNGIGEESDRIK